MTLVVGNPGQVDMFRLVPGVCLPDHILLEVVLSTEVSGRKLFRKFFVGIPGRACFPCIWEVEPSTLHAVCNILELETFHLHAQHFDHRMRDFGQRLDGSPVAYHQFAIWV